MKKIFFFFFFLLFFFNLTAQTIIHITNGEWEPYLSEYSFHYGLYSHIVSEAFKLERIQVIYGFFPWKRSYLLAKNGEDWAASVVWWADGKTEKDFFFAEPVGSTSFVFFHLKSFTFEWESMEDLKGLTIGGTFEYDYGGEFEAALTNKWIKLESVATDEQNYKKLLAGRIDIFPNDSVVGYAQIRNSLPPDQAELLTHHPKKFAETTLSLIISKKNKNADYFLEKFNSGLKKLKESGRFDQMIKDLKAGKYDKQKTKWKE